MMPHSQRVGRYGLVLAVVLLVVASSTQALASSGPFITTIAGGVGGPGPATGVSVGRACAMTFEHGVLYIASNQPDTVIRAVSARSDQLTTPVGDGYPTLTPDGTPGALAGSGASCGVVVDNSGNIIWSDSTSIAGGALGTGHDVIRMLAAKSGTFYGRHVQAGRTYTIAGDGTVGYSGDGGLAVNAKLAGPAGLAITQGDIFFADTGNDRIRVIAGRTGYLYGGLSSTKLIAGHIYTIAGGGNSTADGVPASTAALALIPPGTWPAAPDGVRVDNGGNIVFADSADCEVRVIADADGSFYGISMVGGDIYTIAGTGTCKSPGTGHDPAKTTPIEAPLQLTTDGFGDVIFNEADGSEFLAATTGRAYGMKVIAGDLYDLGQIDGLTADAKGNLVESDFLGPTQLLGYRSGTDFGKTVTAGRFTTIAGNFNSWYSGDGGPALRAQLGTSFADSTLPRVIVADQHADLAISVDGRARFIPVRSGTYFGRSMRGGQIYPLLGRTGIGCSNKLLPARDPSVNVRALGFDQAGNVIAADTCKAGRLLVRAVRSGRFYGKQMRAGYVYLIAGGRPADDLLPGPMGLGVDQAGNIVITLATSIAVYAVHTGHRYCTDLTAGHLATIATGIAPGPVAIDHLGDVLVGEPGSGQVVLFAEHSGRLFGRPVTACHSYPIAGGGTSQANGIPATAANVSPAGIRVDPAGNLIIADGRKVRVVAASTGQDYGRQLIAGRIYTIAGTGASGYSGDGGPASQAELWDAQAVGIAPGHRIVVLDGYRIRLITG